MHRGGTWARISCALVVSWLGVAAPAAALAAEWPTRPVRIIAPSAAGGAADTFARLVAENFSEIFHERFYVENRAGAGGLIGAAVTARAEPDGYTLVTSSIGYHVIAPAISANPGFDPFRLSRLIENAYSSLFACQICELSSAVEARLKLRAM